MPHVIIKLLAGRDEEKKERLAEAVSNAIINVLGVDESSVSVGVQDFYSSEWTDKVYKPDILEGSSTIYKKPGYKPL